ncbi:MAG TPA: DUF2948 family protein [Caulobacteraceae bacterium]|jgi:hypothetical protein
MPKPLEPLRLLAEDGDDLAVISAALQDAIAKIGDIQYEAAARRLTLAVNRFRWEGGGRARERVRAGVQFGGVLAVKARKLRRDSPNAVVELLAVAFEPGEAPGGVIALTFAGGGDLRLDVECVDVILSDVSAAWPARSIPEHG